METETQKDHSGFLYLKQNRGPAFFFKTIILFEDWQVSQDSKVNIRYEEYNRVMI